MKKSVSVSKAQPGAEITCVQIAIEKASRERIQTPQMFKKSLTVSFKPENGMIIYSGLAKHLKFHSSQVKIYPEWSKGHWGIFSKSFENCTIEPPMSPLEKHFSFAEGLLHLLKSIIWRTEKFMYGIICRWNLTACAARISITLQRFLYKYTEQYGYCTIFFSLSSNQNTTVNTSSPTFEMIYVDAE